MPDQPSIVIVKRFLYRGVAEEFSNKYHFSGTIPSDAAGWKTLADAIVAAERTAVNAKVTFVRSYGYEPGSDRKGGHADFVLDYTVAPNTALAGTATGWTGDEAPGDVALTIRWPTPDYSERGKRIYCRKYMHAAAMNQADPDRVAAAQITAYTTFAAKMIDGTLPGSARYCGPQGAVLSAATVNPFLTTRTLKRRGKRPPPPSNP